MHRERTYFSQQLCNLLYHLKSYLAEKLMCDPMRITKKYAGASCLGKRIHNLCESPRFSPQEIEMAKLEIDRLEERFRLRLIQGPGATLPPLPSAPVIHGSIGSFSNARDQGVGYHAVSNNGQQQQSAESIPQVASSSGGTSREQLSFNHPFPMDATNGISGAQAPPTQSSQTKTSSSYSNNYPAAAFLASLTNNPQIVASLSNNSDFTALLEAITQTTAPPPPQAAPVPLEPAPSNSMTLQQILRQANLSASMSSPTVQQPVQEQENQAPSAAAAAGSQFLHPSGSNSTSSAQYQQPHAGLQTVFNSSNASDNDKLAHALLAHITTQLQALAATSPSTLQKVQQQLVQSTIASTPNLWAQVSPNNNTNDPSAHLKTLQQLTSPRAPAPQSQNAGYPGTIKSSGFPIHSYQQATAQNSGFHAVPSQRQQATTNQNTGRQDPAGLLQMLSAQHQQQAPAQSAAARNLQSLIIAQQAAAADAANNAPLANAYNVFMSNVVAASDNPQNANSVTEQNNVSSTSFQAQQGDLSADALSRAISNLVKESQGQSIVGSNTGMDELIDALRKSQAQVSSQAQSNTEERKHNSRFSFQRAKHGRESPDAPWRKRAKLTSKENTERSSARDKDTINSTMIDEPNQEGRIIKKRAKWSSNRVGFHHIDNTANISSKSASSSQFDTEESKSTSSGDNPESDETKNNESTSSNCSSDEGGEDHQVAVPMRKRFN
eukprot:CCRYP_013624-RB/>CCRYP_013624-RB protein AED:0.01 eAED:0.01 QI:946/1/1/1/0.66/0.25/4/1010/721